MPARQGSTYTVEGTSLSDTQRAIRLLKSRAAEWGVDPDRVGVIGFSAGGQLATLAATHIDAGKADATDPIDRISSKVGFFGLTYPATPKDMPLAKDRPAAFLVCGENDLEEGGCAGGIACLRQGGGFGVRATTKGPVAVAAAFQ